MMMDKGSLMKVETALEIFQRTIQETGNLSSAKVAVDAFRQGGFLQVLRERVATWSTESGSHDCDQALLNIIDSSLKRRYAPGPQYLKAALSNLGLEIARMGQISSLLEKRQQIATRQSQIYTSPLNEEILNLIKNARNGFLAMLHRISLSNMPYIIRDHDALLSCHGSILLDSQGLIIQMGIYSDRLGLHKAYVAPGKSFAHIHSSDLIDEPNWEFHYVYPGQKGSHVVGRYCCSMDEVNGDIVGIPVNVAHGGTNNGTIPLELNFCAGGRLPWNYPPQDLLNCSVEKVIPTTDWAKVNGFPLGSTLAGLSEGLHQLFDPGLLGGLYGIELEALIIEGGSFRIHGRGEVIHVWHGNGAVGVAETDLENNFSTGDKFAFLADVEYIVKAVTQTKLLIFRMKDLCHRPNDMPVMHNY
jgi:hypothetical protein